MMGCCPLFTHWMDNFSSCSSVDISFLLQYRFTQQMLSELGRPAAAILLFFNLIIPLPCKNDGTLGRGLRCNAAFTKNIWFLLHSHHIYCHTKIPAAWWRRSEEWPHIHGLVALRRADKQVVGYNCAQYDCMLRFSFCIFLLCGWQKPYILLWGCSGR